MGQYQYEIRVVLPEGLTHDDLFDKLNEFLGRELEGASFWDIEGRPGPDRLVSNGA